MAGYMPSSESSKVRTARIVGTSNVENYTVYTIQVAVPGCQWTVRHRYSEFRDLNEVLVGMKCINKGILPPKKLLGNTSKAFIEKRQRELEAYLQRVIERNPDLPKPLMNFLEFDIYDVEGVSLALAAELFEKGDNILASQDVCEMTPMQLFAITERLKLPLPTCDSKDARNDIGHIMDFLSSLEYVRIAGSKHQLGTSTRRVGQLPFDVSFFKSVKHFQMDVCNTKVISGFDEMKKTVSRIAIHRSISSLREFLVSDSTQWQAVMNTSPSDIAVLIRPWDLVTLADFKQNDLQNIDESVRLLTRVERLDLSHNHLTDIKNLEHLSNLKSLNLSHNHFETLQNLHVKLGNITSLYLAHNHLFSLVGLAKLYSLVKLDVSSNSIEHILEVDHISKLPCLEVLNLQHNPINAIVDYRTKIYEVLSERLHELSLDGQPASSQEKEMVHILTAIQKSKVKQTKHKQRKHVQRVVHEASITDVTSSANSSTNSSLTKDSPISDEAAYREKVEEIRREGGSAWLSMLNEMQKPDETEKEQSVPTKTNVSDYNRQQHPHRTNQPENWEEPPSPANSSSDSADVEDIQISPRALAHCLFDELARHKALGILNVNDLFYNLNIFFKGHVINTFGLRHKLSRVPEPEIRGPNIARCLVSMTTSSQEEFLLILKGLADGSSKLFNPIHPGIQDAKEVYQHTLKILGKEDDLQENDARDEIVVEASIEKPPDPEVENTDKNLYVQVLNTDTIAPSEIVAPSEVIVPSPMITSSDLKESRTLLSSDLQTEEIEEKSSSDNSSSFSGKSQVSLPKVPDYEASLLEKFKGWNKPLLVTLSPSLQQVTEMDSVELTKFFHSSVAQISRIPEKLRYLVWTKIVTFAAPKKDITALVMLSDRTIYFVSDINLTVKSDNHNGWSHRRIHSDYGINKQIVGLSAGQTQKSSENCGVLYTADTTRMTHARCQHKIDLSLVTEVNVGLFDQKLRLTGTSPESTITLLTQTSQITTAFQENLMQLLPNPNSRNDEQAETDSADIYRESVLARQKSEVAEFEHPSGVKFYYPNEETLSDLCYILHEGLPTKKMEGERTNILSYTVCYKAYMGEVQEDGVDLPDSDERDICTLTITNQHLGLCLEDHVSYPLPNFIKTLPTTKHYQLLDVQTLRSIKRIVLSDFSSKDITLVFEVVEVNVDISKEHFTANGTGDDNSVCPDMAWTLILPSVEHREKVIKLICSQWREIHNKNLSIQVSG